MAKKRSVPVDIGAPSKFTPDRTAAIIEAIELGVPLTHAAETAGVHYATFRKWVIAGEAEDKGLFRDFFEGVKEARALFIKNNLAIVKKAADGGTWQAAAWTLERLLPEFFARRLIHEYGDEKPDMSPEEAEQAVTRGLGLLQRHGKLSGVKGLHKSSGRNGKAKGNGSKTAGA